MEKSEHSNANTLSELARLRIIVHKQQIKEVEKRKRTNPQKSEEEMALGVFIEELEPQVRLAILELNRKGYPTYSSGFGGEQSDLQVIEGDFKLDKLTQSKLQTMGVEGIVAPSWKYKIELHKGVVHKDLPEDAKYTTTVQFRPTTSDLNDITDTWNLVASKFPGRGHHAVPPYSKTNP